MKTFVLTSVLLVSLTIAGFAQPPAEYTNPNTSTSTVPDNQNIYSNDIYIDNPANNQYNVSPANPTYNTTQPYDYNTQNNLTDDELNPYARTTVPELDEQSNYPTMPRNSTDLNSNGIPDEDEAFKAPKMNASGIIEEPYDQSVNNLYDNNNLTPNAGNSVIDNGYRNYGTGGELNNDYQDMGM